MPGHSNLNSVAMDNTKKAKVKSVCAGSSDRISSLPQEIKGNILSNLNVEEAVRASILSKAWKNAWTIMPKICLCDSSFGPCNAFPTSSLSSVSPIIARFKFITLVDMALSLHEGPLASFSIKGNKSYHDVFDRWMYMLSKKQPDYVTIKLTSGGKYKIPSSLFCISDLDYLCLKNCIIRLPQDFEGFKWLFYLNLKFFSSTDSDINNLISSCPMLETLRLRHFEGINCLNIRAQALSFLEVEGNFEEVLVDAPNLVHVYLTLDKTEVHQSVPVEGGRKSHLRQTFGCLTCIKELIISGSFLTYLSNGGTLTKLSGVFDHLERISIERCLWNWTEVVAACSLFHNAPILSELDIWSYPPPEVFTRKGIWDQDQTAIQAPTLDHLVTITLNDFVGLDCEIALLGLLLSWSPALEEMKINVDEEMTDHSILKATKKFLALPRASAKARIIST